MSEEPTKAKDSTARERFASTTFRALPHAQTPEGMLEAARAEIAALKSQNTQLGIGVQERMVEIDRLEAEIAALRAECAVKDAALVQVRTRCHGYAAAFGLAERGEELLNLSSVKAGISEMQSWAHAALTPSDACKRYALMGRICCLAAEVESYEMAANPPFRFTEARIELSKALAALRELETK